MYLTTRMVCIMPLKASIANPLPDKFQLVLAQPQPVFTVSQAVLVLFTGRPAIML